VLTLAINEEDTTASLAVAMEVQPIGLSAEAVFVSAATPAWAKIFLVRWSH
jgi:hypothetical protein